MERIVDCSKRDARLMDSLLKGPRAALTENTSCIGLIYLIGEQKRICMDTGTIVVFDKPGKRDGMEFLRACAREYVNIVHGFVKGQ